MSTQKNSHLDKLSAMIIATLLILVPILTVPTDFMLPTASAQGSVNLNAAPSTNKGTLTSSPFQITISNFNVGTQASRLLVVAIQANNQSATSVTFGGTALTKVAGSFHYDYNAFWYLKNPTGTQNIVVTMAGATGVVVGAYAFYGVDQANPIPSTAATFGTGNPKIALTTEFTNSTVLDSVSIFGGSTLSAPTCTNKWNLNVAGQVTGASSLKTLKSAGSATCSWTNSVSGNGWDEAAIEIKAAGIDNPATPIVLNGKGTTSGSTGTAATFYNFKAGIGSDRLLVVGVEANTQSVTSIKYGGTALTKAVSSFFNNDAEFWYLKNPTGMANIDVTFSGTTAFVVGAYSFSGVNQATPIPTTASSHNTAASSPSITITTANPNSLVLDSPSIFGGVTLSSPTCIQQQWNVNVPNAITGASSLAIVPSAAAVTCRWTASAGDLWDDVAIEIKADSLPASTGILEPLYGSPYLTSCNSYPNNFCWQPIITQKQAHSRLPFMVIVNPNSGPCYSDCLNTHNPTADFKNGIGNLTNAGIIVLGYVSTSYGNRPYSVPQTNITQWANWYKPSGVKGIFLDEMENTGTKIGYYQDLTNYAKDTSGFTYVIGNPGTQTVSPYVSSGASDNLDIFEDTTVPSISLLQTRSFATTTPTQGFDKHNFSFLSWCQSSLPAATTMGNESNFVGFMYYTDNCADGWSTIASYLPTLASNLDKATSVITMNSTDSTAKLITGNLVKVSQNSNTIPSGFTPLSYLATSGVTYTFTPQDSGSCVFNHWKDTGSTTRARTITVGSSSKAYTIVYSGTCP